MVVSGEVEQLVGTPAGKLNMQPEEQLEVAQGKCRVLVVVRGQMRVRDHRCAARGHSVK